MKIPTIYFPGSAFDGDLTTAWLENATGSGSGESLEIEFGNPLLVDAIEICPGFFDTRWFKLNCRIKKAQIELGVCYNIFRDKEIEEVRIVQKIICNFPDLMESVNILDTEKIVYSFKITILDVYPTELDQDTAISEVSFFWEGNKYKISDNVESSIQQFIKMENQYMKFRLGMESIETGYFGMLYDEFSWYLKDGTYFSYDRFTITKGTWSFINNKKNILIVEHTIVDAEYIPARDFGQEAKESKRIIKSINNKIILNSFAIGGNIAISGIISDTIPGSETGLTEKQLRTLLESATPFMFGKILQESSGIRK